MKRVLKQFKKYLENNKNFDDVLNNVIKLLENSKEI